MKYDSKSRHVTAPAKKDVAGLQVMPFQLIRFISTGFLQPENRRFLRNRAQMA